MHRRHICKPKKRDITIHVPTGVPEGLAAALCPWRCSQCGARGKVALSSAMNIKFVATLLRECPEAQILPLHALLDPFTDAGIVLSAHRRESPHCSATPVIDLRSEGEQLAGAPPAQPSGGGA